MTRLQGVAVGCVLVFALGGCPPADDDDAVRPNVAFDPPVVDMGDHVAISGLPAPGEVRVLNRGMDRVFLDSTSTDVPWLAVGSTTDDLPIAIEPGAWITLQIRFVGELDGSRSEYDATLGAEVSPSGSSEFDQVTAIEGIVRLTIDCDADGDDWLAEVCGGTDCDDVDPAHNPESTELCNGLDDDCNGLTDADSPGDHGERDADGDGYLSCRDCDDSDPAVHPDAIERCDGVDSDCNPATLFAEGEEDYDSDGFRACEECDDYDHANAPGNVEHCDGADNDCDGALSPLEVDDDVDGFSECDGDCDDTDAAVAPFIEDPPDDGVDSNCDGED